MHIPEEVARLLAEGETIDHLVRVGDRLVYTSSRRMFIKKGSTVQDITLAHISSIELRTSRRSRILALGIALIVGTVFLQQLDPPDWVFRWPQGRLMYGDSSLGGLFYYIIGAVLTIVGYAWKTRSVKIGVSGLSQELVFRGDKDNLNALVKLASERRLQIVRRPYDTGAS